MQNYRIFINHSTIFIGDQKFVAEQAPSAHHQSTENMAAVVNELLNNSDNKGRSIAFVTDHGMDVFKVLRKNFKVIKAAGGIVFNSQGQLLLIKRLGMWDLPKGKIEKGEDQRLAALREVHEECGLNFLGILKKVEDTYHVYFLKGRWILKKTAWYKMVAWGNDEDVTPQLEEDITEVRWVDKAFLKQPDFETYDSLKSLIAKIEFPKPTKK
ncbi:MAG: NUDIX domain-containing protein [Bacteroidota bacterium]